MTHDYEKLAETLEELAAKATPGPWYTLDPPWLPGGAETSLLAGSPDPHVATHIADFEFPMLDRDEGDRVSQNPDADAALIVALVNAVPAITAALRECAKRRTEQDEERVRVRVLEEALKGLHDDVVEYVTLNKLHDADGSPAINNHWMRRARAALNATGAQP